MNPLADLTVPPLARSPLARAHDRITPFTILGPFFPIGAAWEDHDLIAPGATPQGQLLHLTGCVRDVEGAPAAGLTIEIWQANAAGRYRHPSDTSQAPLDPAFRGCGVTRTSAEGRYRFRTVLPGPYPVAPDRLRAPHVHFQFTGSADRHVTQMWFPGHALNGLDRLWNALSPEERERATATWTGTTRDGASQALVATFDIVLPGRAPAQPA